MNETCTSKPECTLAATFSAMYGPENNQNANALALESDGSILLGGHFGDKIVLTAGSVEQTSGTDGKLEALLARFSSSGTPAWLLPLTAVGQKTRIVFDVATAPTTPKSFAAVGYAAADGTDEVHVAFIRAYTSESTFNGKWDHTILSSSAKSVQARAVAMTSTGAVYVAGTYTGQVVNPCTNTPVSWDAADDDLFIAKYSAIGACEWFTAIPGGLHQVGGIAVDSAANVYVTGTYSGQLEGVNLPEANKPRAFVFKMRPSGEMVVPGSAAAAWVKSYGASAGADAVAVNGFDIAVDDTGVVFVTGHAGAPLDCGPVCERPIDNGGAFVMALNPEGTESWVRGFGGTESDPTEGRRGTSLALSSLSGTAQSVYVAGTFNTGLDIDPARPGDEIQGQKAKNGIFLAKLDATTGAPAWFDSFGGGETSTPSPRAVHIAVNGASNTLVMAGTWSTTLDFGDVARTPAGGADIFLTFFSPLP
jgi:hypothetical protein